MIFYLITWKGGAVLKAVIMSHEDGGSYCIDSTGSFHFVKGYENVDIGTEITIQPKKPKRLRRLCVACAAAIIVLVIVGFTCVKFADKVGAGAYGYASREAVYARLCVKDDTRYCLSDIGCDRPCHTTAPAYP